MAKIALLDKDPLAREKMRQSLRMEESYRIVAEGQDGRFALPIMRAHNPDIYIMCSKMPNVNGVEAAKELIEEFSEAKIIMVFSNEQDIELTASLCAGVMGFVSIERIEDWLKEAVRNLLSNRNYMDPYISTEILKEYRKLSDRTKKHKFGRASIFTIREQVVLQSLVKGKSNFEIADELHISDKTVKNHISSILKKSDTECRTRAVVKAIKYGWVKF